MNRLDEIRKERGITVIGLCRRLNISNRTYYKYRSGEWAIPSDCLCNMSRILDVSTDYILGIKNYTHITVTDNEGKFKEKLTSLVGEKTANDVRNAIANNKPIIVTGPQGPTGKTTLTNLINENGGIAFEEFEVLTVRLDKAIS